MIEKTIYTRVQNKHAKESEWLTSTIVPLTGELIVYEPDDTYNYSRYKIGDGVTAVNDLPFRDVQPDWNQNDEDAADYVKNRTHWIDGETVHKLDEKFIPDTIATKDYVESLAKKLNATLALSFYCIEDVTVITNDVSKVYPANSNVDVVFSDEDVFEIIPTSENSILSLSAYPGALGTFYPWLEGVKQFSNILFDMNSEDMYTKWSQGQQGAYQVQYAQYTNCIFWSDNPYISEVSKRTNYTLYYTSQLPLCYSTIPENTFKSFYLAFNVNNDPNWGNPVYRDSFAQATWATQAFSYYGARTIGIFGHDDPDFNIVLPADCRGLMYQSTAIENAGTFDAINTTKFGADATSWQQAFGQCSSLRNLYVKNLKVDLNVSWSPINYQSISFIISKAANENPIKIYVSPYTYNLLSQDDFDLATSKNITVELISTNYVEDKRLGQIANKADKSDINAAIANKKDKDLVVTYRNGSHYYVTHDCSELYAAFQNGQTIYFQKDLELLNLLEINNDYATFYMYYVTQEGKPRQQIVAIANDSIIMELDDEYDYATANQLANKADKQHTHAISDVTNLQTELDARVSAKRTINGKTLEADISLTADDVGADASGSAAAALSEATTYTDTATNNLQQQINSLIPVFIGTQEQYDAKEPEIPVGALVIITDNEIDVNDNDAVSAILGTGKLGYLILN